MSSTQTGLFIVSYKIGTGAMGAPTLTLALTVNTTTNSLSGLGEITQAVNPPVDVHTRVMGTYSEMIIMDSASVLVEATGYPVVIWPAGAGIGPVIPPNFSLRMVLQGWQSGTATYSYLNAEGEWVPVENVPVEMINLPLRKAA